MQACWPHTLHFHCSTAVIGQKWPRTIWKQIWMAICQYNFIYMNTKIWISHNFPVLQNIIILVFSNHLKIQKPFLAPGTYRPQAKYGPCSMSANPQVKWLPSTMLGWIASLRSSTSHGSLGLSAEYPDLHIPLSHTLKTC